MAGASQTLQSAGYRTRVPGSAFTVFTWQNNVIGFAQQVAYVSPTPVGTGATPIQPMDTPYPIEIVTPAAQTIGTITVSMFELYNKKVWEQLAGLAGAPDLVNIFIRVAAFGIGGIQMSKVIRPPLLTGVTPTNPLSASDLTSITQGNTSYGEIYQNCVITNVEDGETIDIGTMFVAKRITLAYTNIVLVEPSANGGTTQSTNIAQQLAARSVPILS